MDYPQFPQFQGKCSLSYHWYYEKLQCYLGKHNLIEYQTKLQILDKNEKVLYHPMLRLNYHQEVYLHFLSLSKYHHFYHKELRICILQYQIQYPNYHLLHLSKLLDLSIDHSSRNLYHILIQRLCLCSLGLIVLQGLHNIPYYFYQLIYLHIIHQELLHHKNEQKVFQHHCNIILLLHFYDRQLPIHYQYRYRYRQTNYQVP